MMIHLRLCSASLTVIQSVCTIKTFSITQHTDGHVLQICHRPTKFSCMTTETSPQTQSHAAKSEL